MSEQIGMLIDDLSGWLTAFEKMKAIDKLRLANAARETELAEKDKRIVELETACHDREAAYYDLEAEVKVLKEANRWIPVEERLPDDRQRVLIWMMGDSYIFEFRITNHPYWVNSLGWDFAFEAVTHWRPLPAPPEREEE